MERKSGVTGTIILHSAFLATSVLTNEIYIIPLLLKILAFTIK